MSRLLKTCPVCSIALVRLDHHLRNVHKLQKESKKYKQLLSSAKMSNVMKYGSQYRLVPEDVYQKLRASNDRPQPPVAPPVSELETQRKRLFSVLDDPSMTSNQKVKSYHQTMQPYMDDYEKMVRPAALDPTAPGDKTTKPREPVNVLMAGMPDSYKLPTKAFISYLEQNPKITWTNDGALALDGTKVPGSNLVDIVNYAVRKRRAVSEPIGWAPFNAFLKRNNAPQEFRIRSQPSAIRPSLSSTSTPRRTPTPVTTRTRKGVYGGAPIRRWQTLTSRGAAARHTPLQRKSVSEPVEGIVPGTIS